MSENVAWQDRLDVIRSVLATCGPLLERCPDWTGAARERAERLAAKRGRVGVAGAQGVGKSTLSRALLATPLCPAPPVPVAEGEETRIPVTWRSTREFGWRELSEAEETYHPGEIVEAEIRRRASVDPNLFDRLAFRSLLELTVERPDLALQAGADLTDLPGVAGNLAELADWATHHVLGRDTQGTVFVLGPGQTIDCTEAEANLIRAYGPLIPRPVFVQNVWSAYDDDVDGTRAANLVFLESALGAGAPIHYLLLDCDAALREAAAGDPGRLAPLRVLLTPVLNSERSALVGEEAVRLRAQLEVLRGVVTGDFLEANGHMEEARKARLALRDEQSALEAHALLIQVILDEEAARARRDVANLVDQEVERLAEGVARYIEADIKPTTVLLEREVARLAGVMSRNLQRGCQEILSSVVETVERKTGYGLRGASSRAERPRVEIPVPEIELTFLRGLFRALNEVIGTGIGVAAAGVGFALGGPVGAVIGGLLGWAFGWLSRKVAPKFMERPVAERQRDRVLAKMRSHLSEVKRSTREQLGGAIEDLIRQIAATLSSRVVERREALGSRLLPSGTDSGPLRAELKALDQACERLSAVEDES